jgi:hypothetical protein
LIPAGTRLGTLIKRLTFGGRINQLQLADDSGHPLKIDPGAFTEAFRPGAIRRFERRVPREARRANDGQSTGERNPTSLVDQAPSESE